MDTQIENSHVPLGRNKIHFRNKVYKNKIVFQNHIPFVSETKFFK